MTPTTTTVSRHVTRRAARKTEQRLEHQRRTRIRDLERADDRHDEWWLLTHAHYIVRGRWRGWWRVQKIQETS